VKTVARLLPFGMPAAMAAVFGLSIRLLGPRRGYIAGFTTYWALCLAAPIALLGPRRFMQLISRRSRHLPDAKPLAFAALALPAAGAVGLELIPELRTATPRLLATSLAIASVNAVAEEAFWRGLPSAAFPDDRWNGWLLPAAGFTAWHLVPLAAQRRWSRAPAILAGAAMIGFGYGWIAWRTQSLRWTVGPHVATDASGLRSVRRAWLGAPSHR